MTVSVLTSSFSYVSIGGTAPRSIQFPFLDPSHIIVTVDGVLQVLGTDYTVAGSFPNATMTPTEAWTVGAAVKVKRQTPAQQQYQPVAGVPLKAASVGMELDRQAMRNMEQDRDAAELAVRTPLALPGQTAPGFDVSGLGEGDVLQYRGGKLVRFDHAPFSGKYVAGGVGGKFVPSSGLGGGDLALRGDLADGAIGALLVAFRQNGDDAEARPLTDKLLELPASVQDLDENAGGGVANDSTAIAAAFGNRETAGKPLLFPKGNFLSAQQTRTASTSFFGAGAGLTTITAVAGLAGALLNMTYAASFFYGTIGNFTLDMTASPAQQAMFINDVHRGEVSNIRTISGAGIKIGAGGDMRLSNLFILDPTYYGLVFDGDIGSEQYASKSLVRVEDIGVTLEAAYAVLRTTPTDTGGFYFDDTRVTRGGGTINNGYLLKGTNATAPSLFAFLRRTVADNINGNGAAYNIIKIKDCFLTDGFGRGTAAEGIVRLEDTQDIYVAGMDLDNGATGKPIGFVGTNVRPMIVRNKIVQGAQAYHFHASAAVTAFVFDDIITSAVSNLTNDGTKLANSMTEYQFRSAFDVVTHPTGGAVGTFNLYDPINVSRIHMRNANGVLQVLNAGFNLILALSNGGLLDLFTGVAVGGQQVVGARGAAIANPSGGATVDAEARTAIISLLNHFRPGGWGAIAA